jgi:hypothetical protein
VSDGGGGAGAYDARREARTVAVTLLRALGSTVALVAIYYLLPLNGTSIGLTIAMLVIGLLGLVVLIAFQVRSIIKASYPALRALGTLATSVPLFLLLFAAAYFVLSGISPGYFSEPLTRTDALYFTVTIFATVGFGDITATTQATRALVMGQMVAGIVVVGLGARILVDATQHGRRHQPESEGVAGSAADSSPD